MGMNYDTPDDCRYAMMIALDLIIAKLAPDMSNAREIVQSTDVMMSLSFATENAQTIVAGMLVPLVERRLVDLNLITQEFGQEVASIARAASIDVDVQEDGREDDLITRATNEGRCSVAIRLAIVRYQLLSIVEAPRKDMSLADTRPALIASAEKWLEIGERYLTPGHTLVTNLKRAIRGASRRLATSQRAEKKLGS